MASARQVEANRRNAQRSTGPRTPAGKARSRRNALKDGLTASTLLLDALTVQEEATITALAGPDPSDAAWEQARTVALAHHALRRCQEAQADLLADVVPQAPPSAQEQHLQRAL